MCGSEFDPKGKPQRFCSRTCFNVTRKLVPKRDLTERFWEKVQKIPHSCWLWTSALDYGGYGIFWIGGGKSRRAHRLAYEALVGPIPEGLTLDHLCRVRRCVNPEHLDPCTAGENAERSPLAPYNVRRAQTHCQRGHPFDATNTKTRSGRRACRTCDNARQRARNAREAATRRAP